VGLLRNAILLHNWWAPRPRARASPPAQRARRRPSERAPPPSAAARRPVSAQLGSCVALLAVRAVAWEPFSIIPGLQSLIHQDQMLAVPGAEMVSLIALLYCCASLPEACQSRHIVVRAAPPPARLPFLLPSPACL
jgi:hypothetical protein